MNLQTDEWTDYVRQRCEKALEILKSTGHSESDIDRLATLTEADFEEGNSEPPSALAVTMAEIIKTGRLALSGRDENDTDWNCKVAYCFGQLTVRAAMYLHAPGFDASSARKPSDLGWLFATSLSLAEKEVFRASRMKLKRAEQLATANVERNKELCKTAELIRDGGAKDHQLASRTWQYWNNRNLWDKYKSKHFNSPTQVRKILKQHGVLPGKKKAK